MSDALSFNLYRLDHSGNAGRGSMTLNGPDANGDYDAEFDLHVNGQPALSGETIKGTSSEALGTVVIGLNNPQDPDVEVKFMLLKSPFGDSYVGFVASSGEVVSLSTVDK